MSVNQFLIVERELFLAGKLVDCLVCILTMKAAQGHQSNNICTNMASDSLPWMVVTGSEHDTFNCFSIDQVPSDLQITQVICFLICILFNPFTGDAGKQISSCLLPLTISCHILAVNHICLDFPARPWVQPVGRSLVEEQ